MKSQPEQIRLPLIAIACTVLLSAVMAAVVAQWMSSRNEVASLTERVVRLEQIEERRQAVAQRCKSSGELSSPRLRKLPPGSCPTPPRMTR